MPGKLLTLAAVLLASGCAGARNCPERGLPLRQGGGGLINPILDLSESLRFDELPSLRRELEAFVARRTKPLSPVREVAVYFRDLNNGPWFGVGERKDYAPASLLKVPIMMSVLKQAEENPSLLSLRLADAAPGSVREATLAPRKSVEPGRAYSIDELLELMIVYSDNKAHDLLIRFLDRKVFARIFEDLQVPLVDVDAPEAHLTVKQYATFFRILYNASYLSRSMSRKALELLARSDFRDGIAAGVPPGTIVANKFGERVEAGEGAFQLHDCGIVYYPKRPYVLCVMTRGRAAEDLLPVIREASELVFKRVSEG